MESKALCQKEEAPGTHPLVLQAVSITKNAHLLSMLNFWTTLQHDLGGDSHPR